MANELLERPLLTPPQETVLLEEARDDVGELYLIEYPGEKFACVKLRSEPGDAIAVFSSPSGARRLLEWIEENGGRIRSTTLDDAVQIAVSKPPICIGVALVDDIDNPKLIRKIR
jgi:hypothetical protein